jgi:hypothetical protein
MMETLPIEHKTSTQHNTQVSLRVEVLLLLALALFLVGTRLSMLGMPTITEREISPALSAWRVVTPNVSGSPIVGDSVFNFWTQATAFATLGGSESAMRLPVALAGVVLVLMVCLFRDLLGRERTFIIMLMLAFSPVLLASSRFSSPVIWSMLFALLTLWGLWRFTQDGTPSYMVFASVMFASLIFLTEKGGIVLALILVGSGLTALVLSAFDAPSSDDLPTDDFLRKVRAQFNTWQVSYSVGLAGLVVFCVATGFLFYPQGLNMVSHMLEAFARGWVEREFGAPIFYPLTTALFYETFLFLFASLSVVWLNYRGRVTFVERFFMAWAVFGLIASLIYVGGEPAHALWIIFPLIGISSALLVDCFSTFCFQDDWWNPFANDQTARWMLILIGFVLFIMLSMHFQGAVRGMWGVDGDIGKYLSQMSLQHFNHYTVSLISLLVTTLLVLVVYFLSSSFVGAMMPFQAFVFGAFLGILLTSFGSGWNLVGTRSDDASEVWFVNGISDETQNLRQTLQDLSFRETANMPYLPVTVVGPDDGVVAWVLRDFIHVDFVESVYQAQRAPVILMTSYDLLTGFELEKAPDLELGGTYLGQSFITRTTWRSGWLNGLQPLAWWSARLDSGPIPTILYPRDLERVVLWVRQDVYDGGAVNLQN